jgi:DUF4097 and DUF4098 domain-containing protein YvlB
MRNLKYYWMVIFSFFAFLTVSISAFGCHDYSIVENRSQDKIIEKSFDTSPGKTFVIKSFSGDVFVRTSDEPKVVINVYGNKKAKEKLDFDFDNSSDGVTVTVKKKDWNFFSAFNNISLRFEITLPKNYNAEIYTAGGDIKLGDLNGEITLNSSGGDISIENTTGNIAAKTSGGDVNLRQSNGSANLSTSGGDIKASSFNGNIDASTSGGDIVMDGTNGEIEASTSGGEVKLDYSGDNKGINLSTSGGGISIRLPSGFNADVYLSTSGGSINCDFKANNVTKFSSSKLEGQFNSGGNKLVAKTSGGGIDVYQK